MITTHFAKSEFEVSEFAARRGVEIIVPAEFYPNLEALCVTVLQPLRSALGRPFVILSGYRPGWLNKAVGGAPSSAHLEARAADVLVPGATPYEVCSKAAELGLPYDQAIVEFGRWSHLSVAALGTRPRRQLLTAVKLAGRTVYRPGLGG